MKIAGPMFSQGFNNFHSTVLALVAVFLLSVGTATAQTERVIYAFQGTPDGFSPASPMIFDGAGNLYGTATFGGKNNCPDFGAGCGIVFELSPDGLGGWTYTVIHSFTGGKDGG